MRIGAGFTRGAIRVALSAAGAAVVAAIAGACTTQPVTGTLVPQAAYTIETVSGATQKSVAAVAQVPMPLDVDGDNLPDVIVTLGLVDSRAAAGGAAAQVATPNLEIVRAPTAVLAGKPTPPLRIVAKVTLLNVGGSGGNTVASLGYDTATDGRGSAIGGSIPSRFRAALGGLDKLFNPLTLVVDTGSATAATPPSYQGPLTLLGNIASRASTTDMAFAYKPLPDTLSLSYRNDGNVHLTYGHVAAREIDMTPAIRSTAGGNTLDVTGRVDRLPRAATLDLIGGNPTGSVQFTSGNEARRPDVGLRLVSDDVNKNHTDLRAELTAVPTTASAKWDLNAVSPSVKLTNQVLDAAVSDPTVAPIGALEASVANYKDAPTAFTPFRPSQTQYVNFQYGALARRRARPLDLDPIYPGSEPFLRQDRDRPSRRCHRRQRRRAGRTQRRQRPPPRRRGPPCHHGPTPAASPIDRSRLRRGQREHERPAHVHLRRVRVHHGDGRAAAAPHQR